MNENAEKPSEKQPADEPVAMDLKLDLRFAHLAPGPDRQAKGEAMAAEILLLVQDFIIAGAYKHGLAVGGSLEIGGLVVELGPKP